MISIIIPVFNEAENLPVLLDHLKKNTAGFIEEIIVVDGGSKDRTLEIAYNHVNIKVIESQKGRAVQMNTGAKIAKSEILYFLHADSFPPNHFDLLILDEIENGKKSGCFIMKFDHSHWWLQLMSQFTRLNHISCRGGDQSLFVKRSVFEKIGGYDENFQVYEDVDFIRKLYNEGDFSIIPKWLITSSRLYRKNGIWKTQLLFIQIYLNKRLGAGPESLARIYQDRINS